MMDRNNFDTWFMDNFEKIKLFNYYFVHNNYDNILKKIRKRKTSPTRNSKKDSYRGSPIIPPNIKLSKFMKL